VPFADFTVSFAVRRGAGRQLVLIGGRAKPPAGVPRARACKGRVRLGAFVGVRTVAAGTVSLHRNCRYSGAALVRGRLTSAHALVSSGVLSVLARFLGNGSILPETVRGVKGAHKCAGSHAAFEDLLYKTYLQPAGFRRPFDDPHRAFNATTGQNAAWDEAKLQWIDTKTLKPLSPGSHAAFEDFLYKTYLQPAGFRRPFDDHTRAFNATTGQNAVWDDETLEWIDVKTGKVLAGVCGQTTTTPPPSGGGSFGAAIVNPGYDHTTPGNPSSTYPSTVCFNLTTNPAKPGAAFTATIMPGGPAGSSRSTSGTLDQNGQAYVVFGIPAYGTYTVSASVTAGGQTVNASTPPIDAHAPPPTMSRSCAGGQPA
jgi:hypothetical protein